MCLQLRWSFAGSDEVKLSDPFGCVSQVTAVANAGLLIGWKVANGAMDGAVFVQ